MGNGRQVGVEKMGRDSKQGLAVFFAFLLIGILAPRAGAEGDWVVRPVSWDDHYHTENADVMVSPRGHVAVGYTSGEIGTIFGGGPPGVATIARLDGSEFDYREANIPSYAATFAMDEFGGVYYASNGTYSSDPAFGYDPVAEEGMQEELFSPDLHLDDWATPGIAVDRQGTPAIACAGDTSQKGTRFLQRDTESGQWVAETISSRSRYSGYSVCFDTNNHPAVGFSTFEANLYRLILVRRAGSVWEERIVGETPNRGYFMGKPRISIAANSNGEVGLAYVIEGEMFFERADGNDAPERPIGDLADSGMLLPHSLAFDPDGNPAIVLGNVLWRLSGGSWAQEHLPLKFLASNVTFDANGNPYVVGLVDNYYTGASNIVLLGKNLPPLARGDMDGVYGINTDDINPFIKAITDANGYAERYTGLDANVLGDINADGAFNVDDIGPFIDVFTGTPSAAPVPEPACLALLAVGGLAALRRRRK